MVSGGGGWRNEVHSNISNPGDEALQCYCYSVISSSKKSKKPKQTKLNSRCDIENGAVKHGEKTAFMRVCADNHRNALQRWLPSHSPKQCTPPPLSDWPRAHWQIVLLVEK